MYCIIIIKFDLSYDSYDTLDLTVITTFKHLLKSVLTEIKDDLTYCDIDEQQFAILFSYTSCSKEKFKDHAENLVSLIQSKISTNIVDSIIITGGSIVNQLFLITDSYEKAKTAFKMNSADSHSSILWYKEAENHKITYYFPVEIQNKLMNNVKQGNKQGVKEILELLFNHNFIKLNLSTSLQKLFIYNLLSIIVKLSSQMEVEEKIYVHLIAVIDHIDKYSDLKQIKTIMDLFYLLCDIINEKSAINQNTCITQEILSYIEDHFSNNSISLSSIADHFNMSESYLSYTF